MDILFIDNARQDEIESFYEAAQRYRDYYRGYPKAHHPLIYFMEPNYMYQCPAEMSQTYLSFPMYHVKYKQPHVLPNTTARTSPMPALPDRTLGGRYNKASCKAFVRTYLSFPMYHVKYKQPRMLPNMTARTSPMPGAAGPHPRRTVQ